MNTPPNFNHPHLQVHFSPEDDTISIERFLLQIQQKSLEDRK